MSGQQKSPMMGLCGRLLHDAIQSVVNGAGAALTLSLETRMK